MDNLTHSLVGWALAETGLKNRTRKGLAACVLAANMPDIDVFFGWAPWAPLAMHRGFTHGLVGGVLLMPPLLAGLLWLLDRWQDRQGRIAGDALPMRFGWLMALCYLGALTHPLLDLQNVYAVQLMSPLSDRWFHTDGLFIVSPWLLVFLGLGIWRARRKVRGWPAVAALAATLGFVLLNIGVSYLAGKALRMSAPYPVPDRVFASPGPVLFWQREVIWRQDGAIRRAHYSPLKRVFALEHGAAVLIDNMADPLVQRAIGSSAEVRDFLDWSQLPFALIKQTGCKAQVTIGDARFTGPEARGGFTVSAMVPLQATECRASVASR
ncbi:MAG: metal-dependent hydrolase [Novosphingobium sp. 16-62-11]|uniref:metal-dependent hydrolase n=1 Tax=Novosphingobium sp. 17-62-19 TaxID=1970406 RepID=UPI000BCEF76C|nr:metal-dependent hydrolase [Novosphingobium sp. 17-62-19]OYZ39134.1 MAG: metal-dependent hydrolase [Novosphingobium sp. 16-62-11]OZA16566.1 MAG: metal-dependent hydrolase [Novosphingobium sp. 17-62-19]HQS96441.1 metal-dependent hydrolase [Novosphingobium sp.]